MQAALIEGDEVAFERNRGSLIDIAGMLEAKQRIPAVAAQLELLEAIQEATFWKGIDLASLEAMPIEIGEGDGKRLLAGLPERRGNPSLPVFVRSLVGMGRAAAQQAFSRFLQDRSLTAPQIRFVEVIVDQLTERGVVEPGALCEIPFTDLHHGRPEGLFKGRGNVLTGIFQVLDEVQPDVQAKAG